jgi:hypothetical protein
VLAAADVDHCAVIDPLAQRVGAFAHAVLHVAAAVGVARIHQIKLRQEAAFAPSLNLFRANRIVLLLAFAENQPVSLRTFAHPRTQVRTQAGNSRTVADVDGRRRLRVGIERRIRHQPHTHLVADRRLRGQPAGRQPAIHLAHHQLHAAVLRYRRQRIATRRSVLP